MTARKPGGRADLRRRAALAEEERLRERGHEAAMTKYQRRQRDRRLMVIPLYALGMVTPEVATTLGLTVEQVEQWGNRDAEIKWWRRAAYEARRDVIRINRTPAESVRLYNKRRKARSLARTAANGGVSPVGAHGTPGTYSNHHCRCDECRDARRLEMRRQYAARVRRTAANGGVAPTPTHGKSTYSSWGCRCDVCRTAATVTGRAR